MVQASSPVVAWLSGLPESRGFDHLGQQKIFDTMDRPLSTVSRDRKYAAYGDSSYEVFLADKGSFMKPSPEGMVDEDKKLWDKILTAAQPVPDDLLLDDDHFESFFSNLRGRSELRVCIDLHPYVVPSIENLVLVGRKEFDCFVEGYNDVWSRCVPFYGPRPQPDHTVGFTRFSFTEVQRQELGIDQTDESDYIARDDIFFPFFTSEVNCCALDIADRPNAHSMTVATRGIVDIYRRVGRLMDINRRITGISISHDQHGARIYAHYPVIENDSVTYWRTDPEEINFRMNNGRERWRCYQVTLNVCQMFGLPLLQRLKAVIDELPDHRG